MGRIVYIIYFVIIVFLFSAKIYAQVEPALPSGLEDNAGDEEVELPRGLDESGEGGPALPEGMDERKKYEEEAYFDSPGDNFFENIPFDLGGFIDGRLGGRTQDDPYERDLSIGETRLQMDVEKDWSILVFKITTDFIYDEVADDHCIDIDDGEGWIDLRELNLSMRPTEFMDIKLGRQIFTWGTGDLLFINDLFPKDWKSFFIGRDLEYLKSPSDAFKASLFSRIVNLDIVYIPYFNSDRHIEGKRISYWNPILNDRSGRDNIIRTEKRDEWFDDDEVAYRLFKNIKGYELALYGYYGFWKSPAGINPISGKWVFPELLEYGASIRGVIVGGITSFEIGYYDSREDSSGSNPFINNSEFRSLAGYEKELAKDFTLGVQYYLEYMMDYGQYKSSLTSLEYARDEYRHVITMRLTKLLMNQNLRISIFAFYSPSDNDLYIRPNVHYKINDYLSGELGGNIFLGDRDYTFFGQFENNTNIYAGIRYAVTS
ncbi:MAG: hypothetical protein SVZ03_00980 [Spirochaetota bacterium]|nr:hypothetical protein [Spirochaetota bacterium]